MTFSELTRARYSCRHYQDRPVESEVLDQILEAGRLAPSAHNNHPSRVIVCDTPEKRALAARAASRFERDGSVFGAPIVLVVCARTADAWVRQPDGMDSSLIDTSIVCDQMMMQATELGLGSCWVCMFDAAVAKDVFGLADGVEPISMLVLGYPADTIAPPATREARRIPLKEFVLS